MDQKVRAAQKFSEVDPKCWIKACNAAIYYVVESDQYQLGCCRQHLNMTVSQIMKDDSILRVNVHGRPF